MAGVREQGERVGEPAADRFGDQDDGGDDERADEATAIGVTPVRVVVAMIVAIVIVMMMRAHYLPRVMR